MSISIKGAKRFYKKCNLRFQGAGLGMLVRPESNANMPHGSAHFGDGESAIRLIMFI